MSIISAVITGLILTLNTVTIQWAIYLGINIDQANYDGNLVLGLILLPIYVFESEVNNYPFT